MKKLTSFLKDWGILVQIALIIVWVLWALQLGGLMKQGFYEELEYQRTGDASKERQTMLELDALGFKLGDKAKALGKEYTPEKYFRDLRILYEKAEEADMTPGIFSTSGIQEVIRKNIGYKNINDQRTMEVEAKKFSIWNENQISHRDEVTLPTLEGFKNWSLSFYLRTMLLLTISYVTKMACRKGILETILASKAKFIASIILWPAFFTKYPYNVIREIRVEAELRRFKDLFKKFSPKKIALVREIANGSNYHSWLNQKRGYNHGLFIALTITICLHIFATPVRAQTPVSEVIAITSIQDYQEITEDSQNENHQTETAMLPNPPLTEPSLFIATVKFAKEIWKSLTKEPLIVIPRNALFGNVTKIANRIRKGINNEKFNSNNLFSSNWFNWSDRVWFKQCLS